MKARVITILDNPQSIESADRCIKSGAKWGVTVEKFRAITPADNPIMYAKKKGIPTENFVEKYSRFENCVSAFLSHHSLWEMCAKGDEEYLILEHDAIFTDMVRENMPYTMVANLGKPSYGKANRPGIGLGPLTSKPYFPGAHAYIVNPRGAKALVERAAMDAGPTDIFLHINVFPWLQEVYPWPIEARDTFTTIQKTEGCLAKHNYNDQYKII
tara:strand:- start:343 stop:984 length:642 start_codon:yes stop_codon:yes gene_type:complete